MKLLSRILFALYLFILLWLVFFKFSFDFSWVLAYQTRSLVLNPFADLSHANLQGMVYNVVVFIPFGLLLSVNLQRATFWRRLAFIILFSLAIEVIQFVFAIGVTDITDVITNTFGGFLGLLLYDLSNKYVDDEKLDRFLVVAGTISLILSIVLLGLLFAKNIRFHASPRKTRQAITHCFEFYNLQRPHHVLDYQVVYLSCTPPEEA